MKRMTSSLAVALALLALPAAAEAQDLAAVTEGARVWSMNCVRCHNARPSTERTDAQWVTVVAHMRARANLTREQAYVVTAFLQATNMPEGAPLDRRAATEAVDGGPPPAGEGPPDADP